MAAEGGPIHRATSTVCSSQGSPPRSAHHGGGTSRRASTRRWRARSPRRRAQHPRAPAAGGRRCGHRSARGETAARQRGWQPRERTGPRPARMCRRAARSRQVDGQVIDHLAKDALSTRHSEIGRHNGHQQAGANDQHTVETTTLDTPGAAATNRGAASPAQKGVATDQ